MFRRFVLAAVTVSTLLFSVASASGAGVTPPTTDAFENCSYRNLCLWDNLNATGGFAQFSVLTYGTGGTINSMGGFSGRASSFNNNSGFAVTIRYSNGDYGCISNGHYGAFGSHDNMATGFLFENNVTCQ